MLASFYEYLEEPWRLDLVRGVVSDFENVVVPVSAELRTGLLQADFNDANIIIRCDEDGSPHPAGVIDFGDSLISWRVNDVAIAMAYVMVCISNTENKRSGFEVSAQPEALLAAAHFLAGVSCSAGLVIELCLQALKLGTLCYQWNMSWCGSWLRVG
jgi:Ser/Thr protein kinase RdoA (MazF antagonist)